MSVIGGDITEITYKHPTLGSGSFFAKSAEDSTIDLGGFRSSDEAQMIDGGGNMIDQINRTRWSVETTISVDVLLREDPMKLVKLAKDPAQAEWTVSHISGAVFKGTGKPVGDLQPNLNQATMSLKLSGGGELKKVVG